MSRSTDRFKHESLEDAESIVAYLQALAEGFAKGSVCLASNGNELRLEPDGLLRMRVEAKRDGDRTKVVMKVSWRNEDADTLEDEPLEVKP